MNNEQVTRMIALLQSLVQEKKCQEWVLREATKILTSIDAMPAEPPGRARTGVVMSRRLELEKKLAEIEARIRLLGLELAEAQQERNRLEVANYWLAAGSCVSGA